LLKKSPVEGVDKLVKKINTINMVVDIIIENLIAEVKCCIVGIED
jgi:hypothetical protein